MYRSIEKAFSEVALHLLSILIFAVFRTISEFGRDAEHPLLHAALAAVIFACASAVGDVRLSPDPVLPAAPWSRRLRKVFVGAYAILLILTVALDLLSRLGWPKESVLEPQVIALVRAIRPVLTGAAMALSVLYALASLVRAGRGAFRRPTSEPKQIFAYADLIDLMLFMGAGLVIKYLGKADLILILLLIYLARCAADRTVALALFVAFTAGLLIAPALWIRGLLEDIVLTFPYGVCHSVGFNNPNALGFYIFMSFLMGWYLWRERYPRHVLAAGIGVCIGGLTVTGCRTMVVLVLLLLTYDAWFRRLPSRTPPILITCLPLLMTGICVAMGLALYPLDDKIHSNVIVRMVDAVYAMKDKGLSLLPQSFSGTARLYYFDTVYYRWPFLHGLIATAALLVPVMRTNFLIARRREDVPILLLLVTALFFCMESHTALFLILALASAESGAQRT